MRVHSVKKARKDQGACESCREAITPGMAYRYIAPRYGPKRKRHATCPAWRPSEMTSSKLATAYAGQESAEDALDALDPGQAVEDHEAFLDEVRSIVAACGEVAEECAEDYQEGIDSMPDGLQESPIAEESQEKIDILQDYASELSGWEPHEADPPQGAMPADELPCPECGVVGSPQTESEDGIERRTGRWDCNTGDCAVGQYDDPDYDPAEAGTAIEEWAESVIEEAREAIAGLEL